MNNLSYLNASIEGIHNRWLRSLEDLKDITHKPSKQDHLAYMQELVDEANHLNQEYGDLIHPIHKARLLHIINRNFITQNV